MKVSTVLVGIMFFSLSLVSHSHAQFTYGATLLGAGSDQRVDAAPPCASEPDFVAGALDGSFQLKVAGESAGCDAEWGASVEFDMTGIGAGTVVNGAVLRLRNTGYADGADGLPYLGVFAYGWTGSPVNLPRADLNDQTALAIFSLTGSTGTDVDIDVTDHVVSLLEAGMFQAGFFVCGVYSEAGYNDLVYFGGASHANPPQLILTTEGPVVQEPEAWGDVKTLYR